MALYKYFKLIIHIEHYTVIVKNKKYRQQLQFWHSQHNNVRTTGSQKSEIE